jgi:hypothetical protein
MFEIEITDGKGRRLAPGAPLFDGKSITEQVFASMNGQSAHSAAQSTASSRRSGASQAAMSWSSTCAARRFGRRLKPRSAKRAIFADGLDGRDARPKALYRGLRLRNLG